MHQPWASLLIAGIKRYEGRGWLSKHRGTLWIASTSQEPDIEDIKSLEAQYTALYGAGVRFPKHYPKSALLGTVNVTRQLTQRDFQALRQSNNHNQTASSLPIENSMSKYLFECTEPQRLRMPVSMTGQHKIYALHPDVHAAVKENLVVVPKLKLGNR
jgi:hypothetical protein